MENACTLGATPYARVVLTAAMIWQIFSVLLLWPSFGNSSRVSFRGSLNKERRAHEVPEIDEPELVAELGKRFLEKDFLRDLVKVCLPSTSGSCYEFATHQTSAGMEAVRLPPERTSTEWKPTGRALF